jgi:glycosyltransferase involved in cell wall biosynthesis
LRKSYIWRENLPYEFDEKNNCWKFTHGTQVIKTESWIDLPSPPKPSGIQISVVIVNWNRPLNVVESSIASVLNQDFPPENFEVILVDDASELSPKPVCLDILREYPNHNFRAYLLNRTRSWNCGHVYNVGFKRALGWIVAMLHSDSVFDDAPERALNDSYPRQPVLEGMWRHHNARDRLALSPRMLWMPKENEYKPWYYFPHCQGLSLRKAYVEAVHGVTEKRCDEPLLDFLIRLMVFNIKITEDVNIQVIHRNYMLPKNLLEVPSVVRPPPPNASYPDWPNEWGEITENEEKNILEV